MTRVINHYILNAQEEFMEFIFSVNLFSGSMDKANAKPRHFDNVKLVSGSSSGASLYDVMSACNDN